MIGIVATLKVKDGMQETFESTMRAFVKDVREKEPGTVLYSLTRKQGSTTEYVVMEQYKSAADVDAHNTSAHFQALLPRLGPCLDGAPAILTVDVLG
jgi:quinol monooxygenase YgiN